MTRDENKYATRESNRIKKRKKPIESNQIKTTSESNQIENCESNQVEPTTKKTADANDGFTAADLMGRIITRRCDCGSGGDCNVEGDARV